LEQINLSMSTFRPQSEISRFNASNDSQPLKISADFLRVMLCAREIFHLTDGAWDGTVDPLVNLWGFGKQGAITAVPADEAIAEARKRVGFDRIEVMATGHLKKRQPDVSLDLASIAKGYGVDQVAILLHGLGYKNYLVEIGGEVYAAGVRLDGTSWRVGINQPSAQASTQEVYTVLRLHNCAMATSGDYRNFYQLGDRTVSHIIDPHSGMPLDNKVVSVSVIADTCALADGLATGLMVMGPQKGLELLERLPGVEGLIVVRHGDGRLENFASKGLADLGL
jgi:thiamine biosynthesis lipoprotein